MGERNTTILEQTCLQECNPANGFHVFMHIISQYFRWDLWAGPVNFCTYTSRVNYFCRKDKLVTEDDELFLQRYYCTYLLLFRAIQQIPTDNFVLIKSCIAYSAYTMHRSPQYRIRGVNLKNIETYVQQIFYSVQQWTVTTTK